MVAGGWLVDIECRGAVIASEDEAVEVNESGDVVACCAKFKAPWALCKDDVLELLSRPVWFIVWAWFKIDPWRRPAVEFAFDATTIVVGDELYSWAVFKLLLFNRLACTGLDKGELSNLFCDCNNRKLLIEATELGTCSEKIPVGINFFFCKKVIFKFKEIDRGSKKEEKWKVRER